MFRDEVAALNPVSFFSLRTNCYQCQATGPIPLSKKYIIPDSCSLNSDDPFAELRMGWSNEGIAIHLTVDKAVERTVFPRIDMGDGIELFFDTRDVKTSGFNTRFCHHFFFLPQPSEGHDRGELTRFRTEDRHSTCESNLLQLSVKEGKKGYVLKIFIPSDCLVGYDPEQFGRFGFTYRIHRAGDTSQHFAVHSDDYRIEEQPSLWATVRMEK